VSLARRHRPVGPASHRARIRKATGEDDRKLGEKTKLLSLVCFRERKL